MPKNGLQALVGGIVSRLKTFAGELGKLSSRTTAIVLAGTAVVTVATVVIMLTFVIPDGVRGSAEREPEVQTPLPRGLRVPDWEYPDSTEVLKPPIIMIRGETGPWRHSEIEPYKYDSVDAVREYLRRENDAALRRVFARVP